MNEFPEKLEYKPRVKFNQGNTQTCFAYSGVLALIESARLKYGESISFDVPAVYDKLQEEWSRLSRQGKRLQKHQLFLMLGIRDGWEDNQGNTIKIKGWRPVKYTNPISVCISLNKYGPLLWTMSKPTKYGLATKEKVVGPLTDAHRKGHKGSHSMVLIGYDMKEKTFTFQNSWRRRHIRKIKWSEFLELTQLCYAIVDVQIT